MGNQKVHFFNVRSCALVCAYVRPCAPKCARCAASVSATKFQISTKNSKKELTTVNWIEFPFLGNILHIPSCRGQTYALELDATPHWVFMSSDSKCISPMTLITNVLVTCNQGVNSWIDSESAFKNKIKIHKVIQQRCDTSVLIIEVVHGIMPFSGNPSWSPPC